MKNVIRQLFILMIVFFLSGCIPTDKDDVNEVSFAGSATIENTSFMENTSSPTIVLNQMTVTPGKQLPVTPEYTPVTPSLTSTPVLTSTQAVVETKVNSFIASSLPDNVVLDGSLVIQDRNRDITEHLWKLETGVRKQFTNDGEYLNYCSVSPNGFWLACACYPKGSQPNLVFYDTSGKQETVIPWDENWLKGSKIRWMNDQRVVIQGQPGDRILAIERYVIDPFTGDQYELPTLSDELDYISLMFTGVNSSHNASHLIRH